MYNIKNKQISKEEFYRKKILIKNWKVFLIVFVLGITIGIIISSIISSDILNTVSVIALDESLHAIWKILKKIFKKLKIC